MTTTGEYSDLIGREFVDVPLSLPGVPDGAELEVVEAHWKLALSITKEVTHRG